MIQQVYPAHFAGQSQQLSPVDKTDNARRSTSDIRDRSQSPSPTPPPSNARSPSPSTASDEQYAPHDDGPHHRSSPTPPPPAPASHRLMYATADHRTIPLSHSRAVLARSRSVSVDRNDGSASPTPSPQALAVPAYNEHATAVVAPNASVGMRSERMHDDVDDIDDEEHIRVDAYDSDDQMPKQRHSGTMHRRRYSKFEERELLLRRDPSPVHAQSFCDINCNHNHHHRDHHEHPDEHEALADEHREADERHFEFAEQRRQQHQQEQQQQRQQHHEEQHLHDMHSMHSSDLDEPLDLSLPSGRRRNRTFSGTDSDDSSGPCGDDKVGGKAAYKKNLMKRYRKCNMIRYDIPYNYKYINAYTTYGDAACGGALTHILAPRKC